VAEDELVAAVRSDKVEAVRRALDAGADPNATVARRDSSVLAVAAQNGSAEIVRLLLSAGASPDWVSGFEWTPLRAAATHGHAEVVKVLLERGANPNSGDKRGSIAHEILGPTPDSRSKVKILQALLAADATALPQEEPLIVDAVVHTAVPAILRILVAHGENPNQRRRDGTPVLVLAARLDDPGGVDTLLQSGADVDATDAAGRSALMHAVERGHESVTRILLASGADPDMRTPDGTTALQIARGLHRTRMQLLLGVKEVRPEAIQVARTTMELTPKTYELQATLSSSTPGRGLLTTQSMTWPRMSLRPSSAR
jgi:hypothetical protein